MNTCSTNSAIGHSPIGWNSGSAQYAYVWASGSALQQFCYAGGNTGSGPCKQSSFTGGGTLAISSTPTGGDALLWAFLGGERAAPNTADGFAPGYCNNKMSSRGDTGGG